MKPETSTKIERAFDFTIDETRDAGDGLTLEGYAAVFNSPTTIDSWEGKFSEVIAPGAFRQSIGDKTFTPVMQFNHGRGYMGDLPIGTIKSLKEDARGLRVRARLLNSWMVEPVKEAIKDGAISGMSFRFTPIEEEWSEDNTVRTLNAVQLHELGPVVFPAYRDTSVSVRSSDDPIFQLVSLIRGDESLRSELASALVLGGSGPLADDGGDPVLADGNETQPESVADETPDDDWRSDALALADLIDREIRLTERRRLL